MSARCLTPSARASQGRFGRRLSLLLVGCMGLALLTVASSPPTSVGSALSRSAAADACAQSPDAGEPGPTNWAMAPASSEVVCDIDAEATGPANWGMAPLSTGLENAAMQPAADLVEAVGQAAGEVGLRDTSVQVVNVPTPRGGAIPVVEPRQTPVVPDLQTPVVPDRPTPVVPELRTPEVHPTTIPAVDSSRVPSVLPQAPAVTALPLDPKWNNVVQWMPDILRAQQQVYSELDVLVPTNVIMAEMMIESQGIMPDGANYAGAAGLLQVTAMTIGAGHYDLARVAVDPAYSIYCGTYELALRFKDSGEMPWENVVVGYFSGHYIPNGAADAYNSDFNYQRMFLEYMRELEAAGALGGQGAFPSIGTSRTVIPGNWLAGQGQPLDGLVGLWGRYEPAPLTQEFGPTDFSVYVHPEWYTYALAYGFAQPGHTGLDVGIPAGTPLYSPADGVIVCAGTDNGTGEDSCAAFTSSYGGWKSGRLQIKLPNGDMLILGHVNYSDVEPGQRVTRGQRIGVSGSQNGDHVHVEYRTPDLSTETGWRIIDPRLSPISGISITSSTGQTQPPSQGNQAPAQVNPAPTATPKPTPKPTATPTPTPTPTPTSTPTPTVTPTVNARRRKWTRWV